MTETNISDLLAEALAWISDTGGSHDEAAARYPDHSEELLELLETVSQIEQTEQAKTRSEFKSAARTRMINLIEAQERANQIAAVTKTAPPRQIKQNHNLTRRLSMTWIIVLGIFVAALAGGGGAAYASADALPGDALYPIKTAIQNVELTFSGDTGDIDLLLGNMDGNIQELQLLLQLGRQDDMLVGLDHFQLKLKALNQVRSRVSYEDAGTEESLNDRIQTQLQLHTEQLEQIKLQTQDHIQLQEKLQLAIQLTNTGNTYGPNDGGQPDEPGAPNGAGPGEPVQEGKPEDAGSGQGGKNEDPGPGPNNDSNGQGGKPDDAGTGAGESECTCQEEGLYCVLGEVQNEFGQVQDGATCTCMQAEDSYCWQYQYQYQYGGENGEENGEHYGNENGQSGKP